MSLETDIRRDANPTPTRFLMECGAFTPGFGLSLENYNPFDASLKMFNTGTPKTELNPFDSSFRAPSSAIAVLGGASQNVHPEHEKQQQQQQQRHPWADIMFDEGSMPMPQMSPGLSPSSSSSSGSPSPSIRSPPTQTLSLNQFHPSMAIDPQATHAHTYDHNIFENLAPTKKPSQSEEIVRASPPPSSATTVQETLSPSETLQNSYPAIHDTNNNNNTSHNSQNGHPFDDCHNGSRHYKSFEEDEENEENEMDFDERAAEHDIGEHDEEHDQELDAAMSALDMRRYSTMSDIQLPAGNSNNETRATGAGRKNAKTPKTSKAPKATAKSKRAAAAAAECDDLVKASSRKSTKSGSRKRSCSEEDTPEMKRQKFLERNRTAASKCREKKRLQTLKTISDADEITARNRALHETLDQLQEEVRQLKNQILCHRDCGCDVIQKFVQTSFEFISAPGSKLPSFDMHSSSVPPMQLY